MRTTRTIHEGEVRFSSDSQLLAELGERLIATPHVALAELIKNAYDADATKVHVWLDGEDSPWLNIQDNGHGMTEEEFCRSWMTIASTAKLQADLSRRFRRPITGSKGVGRFAVRLLGRTLQLETVARDHASNEYRRLAATFNWDLFSAGKGIDQVAIRYTVESGFSSADEGTVLRIGRLQGDWTKEGLTTVTGPVLDLVSPPFANGLAKVPGASKHDPGFFLFFSPPGEESVQTSAAAELYDRYLARVVLEVSGPRVVLKYDYEDAEPRTYERRLRENLVGELNGEIRYYPRRAGRFLGLRTTDGRSVTRWLREKGGVRVIDRSFRLLPYGEPDDDWLQLSASKATYEREWGSSITKELYPESQRDTREAQDPLLKVPANHQLLGAVYLQSYRPKRDDPPEIRLRRLQPAMDRQGFVENDGFRQLVDIVRGSIELLAVIDVEETARRLKRQADHTTREARRQIEAAIERVRGNPDISRRDKAALIASYERIASRLARAEEAHREARRAVETMSLLGVLSAFMTHEATVMLRAVERMLSRWRRVPRSERDAEYEQLLDTTEQALQQLRGHLDYAKAFLGNVRDARGTPFKVRAQVNLVVRQLERFAKERSIVVENRVPEAIMSPGVSVSLYSGVLLNLYTNALKAVLALRDSSERRVRFDAEETEKGQVVRVSDTGIGVPEELRDRIFDPLFSTTDIVGPLGSSLGLGLHIVRRILEEIGGSINLAEPPEGFRTCFEVRFPR